MAIIASLLVPSSARTEAETSSPTTFLATNALLGGIVPAQGYRLSNKDILIGRRLHAAAMLRRARHHRFVVHQRWVVRQKALKAQRAAVERLRLQMQASSVPSPTPPVGGSPEGTPSGNLSAIAQCESGGDPTAVSSNGIYRGKYQFSRATWQAMGGTGDPATAPESVQDAMAEKLMERSGSGQWPVCGATG